MNKVILLGRMAREPEVRFTQGNEPTAVCRFSVAVERPYSSKRKEGDATADFINCVCFGKRGENIGQYFHKGNRIAITGRLQGTNSGSVNNTTMNSAPAPTSSPAQPSDNNSEFFPIVDDDEELPF